MKTELLPKILEGMEKGKNLKAISSEMYYSPKEISRIIIKHFGVDYCTLFYAIYNPIVVHAIHSTQSSTEAASLLDMTSQNLSNYTLRHIGNTPSKIKSEVYFMNEKTVKEVLLILVRQPEGQNITLRQLGVNSDFIRKMRKAGLPVISVPGRNGGYNLERTSLDSCLSWINNIRKSMGIGPLTFLY